MPWAPRFTTREWLVGVGLVAYSLAMGRALDVVLGWFVAVLIACYLLADALSTRWRLRCAGATFLFALISELRTGGIGFVFPGLFHGWHLPVPYAIAQWFDLPFRVIELPLAIACDVSPEFDQAIGSGGPWERVEPYMVFAFWFGVTTVFAMSIVSSLIARRKRKQSLPAP